MPTRPLGLGHACRVGLSHIHFLPTFSSISGQNAVASIGHALSWRWAHHIPVLCLCFQISLGSSQPPVTPRVARPARVRALAPVQARSTPPGGEPQCTAGQHDGSFGRLDAMMNQKFQQTNPDKISPMSQSHIPSLSNSTSVARRIFSDDLRTLLLLL